jgi:serine/threonine protein kinase
MELTTMPDSPLRVFISYSHDSPEHKDRVLVLCDRLREDGIDAWIDQYEISPPEGWPRWCTAQVREAEYVLVVCSEIYERRFRGTEESGNGLGVAWEGYVVAQELYDAGSRNTKFIPVLFPGGNPGHIPEVLRGSTRYELDSKDGYGSLYRHLTGQPGTIPPPVGARVALPRQERRTDRFFFTLEPRYEDDRIKGLSEALEVAYRRLEDESTSGEDTTSVREEILRIRREIRDGPRLQAGEFLSDGRFRLIDILGRGGFATVWKAWDRKRHELVAVKVLHGQHSEDRSRRERFFRGARKMAELLHPGVVRVLEEHLEDGGHHFFVMEYASGGDLRQAVLEERFSRDDLQPLISAVGQALSFAHEKGVIHRDVKPANILLQGKQPKLTDFDLVRAFDTTGGTQTHGMMGTFLYSAPEVLNNAKEAGVAADVYSLAMTTVFVLSGRDLSAQVLRDPMGVLQGINCSPRVRETLLRGIAWEPGERPQTVDSLIFSLGKFTQGSFSRVAEPKRGSVGGRPKLLRGEQVEEVIKVVAKYYDLKVKEIKSKSNSQQVVFPRKVAMYLLRKLSELSYPEIGKMFNDKHHSTVMYAVQDIENRREKDPDLDRVLLGLEQRFDLP